MNFQKHTNIVTKYTYAALRVTFCFWVGNVPYILLLMNLIVAENSDEILTLLLTMFLLIPVILMPVLTACLSITRKFFTEDTNDFSLMKCFLKAYKDEYKRSVGIGVLFNVLCFLLVVAWQYYTSYFGILGYLYIVLIAILIYVVLNMLNLINDQFLSTKEYLQNSIQLLLRYPFLSITGILEIFLVIYVSYLLSPSLLIFVSPGAVLLLSTFLFRNKMKVESSV